MVSAENVGALARKLRVLRSLLSIVIVRQGLLQIIDTLIEPGAIRVKTDIGAGQTLPRQGGLTGALGRTRREQCGKAANQDDP